MFAERYTAPLIALLILGSAILLSACKGNAAKEEESLDRIKTEESENLTIIMSENGRKSYLFATPLLEGYMLGRDPYREFNKGISITTYQDDSLTTVNAVLVANYAIYYENRKLWEAKGDVVVTKHDGTRLYTQQLFWNSMTKRIYSNVDTRLVTDTDELIGEGFESDEEMNEPRFRRWRGKMQVDADELRNGSDSTEGGEEKREGEGKDSLQVENQLGEKLVDRAAESKDIQPKEATPQKGPEANELKVREATPQRVGGAPKSLSTARETPAKLTTQPDKRKHSLSTSPNTLQPKLAPEEVSFGKESKALK